VSINIVRNDSFEFKRLPFALAILIRVRADTTDCPVVREIRDWPATHVQIELKGIEEQNAS
jgi:hypothetical protein